MTSDVESAVAERVNYAEQRRQQRYAAAARLEELAAIAKTMVLDLRGDGESREDADLTAYGRVFWLRRQLGYVVASLGAGAPPTWVTRVAEREYGEEAGWNSSLSPSD